MSSRLRGASSIGIIGGADGPTAIFLAKPKADSQWHKTVERCKAVAVPREPRVTGDELVHHLKEAYGAYEIPVSHGKRQAFKMNVLMNHHSAAVSQPPIPPQDANIEDWKKWAEHSHMNMEAARNIPDEQYGLLYTFLAIPRNANTERFYMEAEREQQQPKAGFWQRLFGRKTPPVRTKKMVFSIELSTGHWQMDDGCKALMDEITLWRGVTQQDIEHETPPFTAYAAAMRDTGLL